MLEKTTEASLNKLEEVAFNSLKNAMNAYSEIDAKTWGAFRKFCTLSKLKAGDTLYESGQSLNSFSYVYLGLLRCYVCDENGKEFNKRFFPENTFPGVMQSLLLSEPSQFTIEALEDSVVILIDHDRYRALLNTSMELQRYHIQYLEKNWLIKQERLELSLVQEDAQQRYKRLLNQFPSIEQRIPLFHIASHLGITPTQLSRIRKLK